MFIVIYLLSIFTCLVGWYRQYKNEYKSIEKTTKIFAVFLSLFPGLNTIIALAFLSEFTVKW